MSLLIVSHCYAVELPQYAQMLRYQLSSLVLHPPKLKDVEIEVVYTPEDKATVDVIHWFVNYTSLSIGLIPLLPPGRLFRRSIGRNIAALRSHAELVWFTDVDHVFGEGCIDSLWQQWNTLTEWTPMLFPGEIQIHKDHATGDALWQGGGEGLADVDPTQFVPKQYNRAIGGVQIVPGSLARKHGYLNDRPEFQAPLERPFSTFSDDVAYRRWCATQGPIKKIQVSNLFRLRHTATTYQGK